MNTDSIEELETSRLKFRKFKSNDAPWIIKMYSDPDTVKNLNNILIETEAMALEKIKGMSKRGGH